LILINWAHLLLWYPLPFRVNMLAWPHALLTRAKTMAALASCVQLSSNAWAMKACRQASNIGAARPRTHRALADKIPDPGGGDTMTLTGKRVRSISLKDHGISIAYCRSSISAIIGARVLKAGNIPSSGLRQQINS